MIFMDDDPLAVSQHHSRRCCAAIRAHPNPSQEFYVGCEMRALIERQLYRPEVVMPLLILTGLMVTLDFNLLQIILVVVLRGARRLLDIFRRRSGLPASGGGNIVEAQRCPVMGRLCTC